MDGYVQRGHRVDVVKFTRFVLRPISVSASKVSVTLIPRRSRGYLLTSDLWARERRAAVEVIRAHRPDVVHAHWTYEYARATLQTKLPSVITAHDVPSRLFGLMRPKHYWWPRLLQGYWIAKVAPRMTAQSPYTLNCWQKEMHRFQPIDLVPNPIGPDVLDLTAEPVSLHGYSFAASSNGFGARKNTTNLLLAFGVLRRSVPEATLVLFGSEHGPNEKAHLWAVQHGLETGVDFLGKTDRLKMLRHMVHNCSVFVHPSLEESFGMAVAEAMALGMPVVGGRNAGAVPWLLDDGRAGVLCDVDSPDDISAAMLKALSQPSLGALGRERIFRSFSLSGVVDRYLEILSEEAGG